MKITGVETTSLPARESPTDGTHGGRQALIQLKSDTGLAGFAVVESEAVPAVEALVRDGLAGADPRATMGLWERMNANAESTRGGHFVRARAALDIAMWDLKAKGNDEPLWKTLGGTRPRARAHLAWDRPWDGCGATDWFRRRRAETGIRSASLAAGSDPAHDLTALSDVRDVLEATVPDSTLMLRFDGTDWPRDVIRHVRALETRFDLACVCSPVRRGDVGGARQIGDAVRAAVCVGHGEGDVEAFLPYLRHYAANVIELDIAALGISGSIQVADAAFG
ncbi:MAG TPA: enolase C-terminal domain-like protein, partial [Woeseiaceae bacterium]|nr:enolase C-terminal domain-like protein [Woeseiaceae bacterium]